MEVEGDGGDRMLLEYGVERARGCHPQPSLSQGRAGVREGGGGGPGVECVLGAFERFGERRRIVGGPDEEGGVEGNDIPEGAGVMAFEDAAQEAGVGVRVGADLEGVVVDGAEAERLGVEARFVRFVRGDFDDSGWSGSGDFGAAFDALDDEGAGPATALHESDDAFDVGRVGDADDVVGCVGKVVELFEGVEDGAYPDFGAEVAEGEHGGGELAGVEVGETGAGNLLADNIRGLLRGYIERVEEVGEGQSEFGRNRSAAVEEHGTPAAAATMAAATVM